MFEKETCVNNVVPMKAKSKGRDPMLQTLLQDQDVRDFFKFVHENDLRVAALELLNAKLSRKN